jgi:bifunctional polynucleotide phosphatase/kinase
LGTAARCKKAVEAAISEGKSVVIDNTNGSKDSMEFEWKVLVVILTYLARAEYIKIAKANQLKVRCFYFETPLELANHLNFVRVKQSDGAVRRIPPVAYHTYNKKFEEPDESEGIDEVKTIEFVPDLSDANYKKVFLCYNPDF